MASTDSNTFKAGYTELMEQVSVTPEMRDRVLAGVADALEEDASTEDAGKARTPFTLLSSRRYLAVAACLLIVLIVGVTLLTHPPFGSESEQQGGDTQEGLTYFGAPLELATREELEAEVGVSVPEVQLLESQATEIEYVSLWGDIAEVRYLSDKGKACLRVSPKPGDNSGDYNDYKVVKTLAYGGVKATLKGTNEGYCLATWNQDGHGVSIGFDYPVSYDTLVSCVKSAIDGLEA